MNEAINVIKSDEWGRDKETTLEHLCQECDVIYVDNSILNRAHNIDTIRKSVQKNSPIMFDFGEMLGACWRFSGVNFRHLYRQARFAAIMQNLFAEHPSIRSVPEIVDEHSKFLEHIELAFEYLRKNSVQRSGKKEHLLRVVIEEQKRINDTLKYRSNPNTKAEELASYLCANEFNKEIGDVFRKRYGRDSPPSFADASLVSHALLEDLTKEVAIATADVDIINFLRNYRRFSRNLGQANKKPETDSLANSNVIPEEGKTEGSKIFPYFPPCRSITVYFPHTIRWFPELHVTAIYNTTRHTRQ